MGAGSLSLERFSYFTRQDCLFLIDYCRVVSLACAKSPMQFHFRVEGLVQQLCPPSHRVEVGHFAPILAFP